MNAAHPIRSFASGLLRIVVLTPVRSGRLTPAAWPAGLQMMGAICLVAMLAAVAHILAADDLRQHGDLVPLASGSWMPAAAVPMVSMGVFLSLTLIQTAALHLWWPFRTVALLVGAAAFATTSFQLDSPLVVTSAIAFAGLLVLHLVRAGKAFSSAELIIVSALVFVGTQLPFVLAGAAQQLGFETRGLLLQGQLQYLTTLAIPALVVAGTALAQVTVTTCEAIGQLVTRRSGHRWGQPLLAVLLVWAGVRVTSTWASELSALLLPRLLGGLATIALVALVAWPFVARARRSATTLQLPPGEAAEKFSALSWVLATGSFLWAVVPLSLFVLVALARTSGIGVPGWLEYFTGLPSMELAPTVSRLIVCAVLLVVAWRTRDNAWFGAMVVAAFAAPHLFRLLGHVTTDAVPLEHSSSGVDLWLLLLLLAATAHVFFHDRAHGHRLASLITAAALMVLYEFRHLLADPLEVAFGFSALAVLLFGLLWRALTDGEFTRGHSRRWPMTTRVLLFLANSLFAVTVVTWATLTRDPAGRFDLGLFEDLGATTFSDPLRTAFVLVCLGFAVHGSHRGNQVEGQLVQGPQHGGARQHLVAGRVKGGRDADHLHAGRQR